MEGFSVTGFYDLGLAIQTSVSIWTNSVDRAELNGLVDHYDITTSLLPSIFVFCVFLVLHLLTYGLGKLVPKMIENETAISVAEKS